MAPDTSQSMRRMPPEAKLVVLKKPRQASAATQPRFSLNAAKGIITIVIIKGNLQKLPQPELFMVLDGLVKQIPKIEGIQRQYGISIFWQLGGDLYDAAFTYGEYMLTKDKAGKTLRVFKIFIGHPGIPELDASNQHDDPESESELELEQDCPYKRPKHRTVVEPSPSDKSGHRRTPALDHCDSLASSEQEVYRDDDDSYIALPGDPFSPSPTVDDIDIISVDDYQLETTLVDNQSISQLARRQLQDPAVQLETKVNSMSIRLGPFIKREAVFGLVLAALLEMENVLNRA
ncbi:hypothetical protein FNYG_14836 [Fusarium nygamai]|uniref:Uncharacterized protein n=1 Tax=Gibberella nygamai TaxID=42673 RepID=A0A2K0UPJ8_GIBNY|nr:hypothetical protein FNYG_14836 [Fusarium nygamai]